MGFFPFDTDTIRLVTSVAVVSVLNLGSLSVLSASDIIKVRVTGITPKRPVQSEYYPSSTDTAAVDTQRWTRCFGQSVRPGIADVLSGASMIRRRRRFPSLGARHPSCEVPQSDCLPASPGIRTGKVWIQTALIIEETVQTVCPCFIDDYISIAKIVQ